MIRWQNDFFKQLTRCFYSGRLVTLVLPLSIVLGLSPAVSVLAQAPAPSSPQVEHRKTSKPYSGDLSTFEYKDRAKKLHVERVMDILGISSGKTVADIGAGSGWFAVRAAKRVTPAGLVYAVDINPKAISYIQERVRRDGIPNLHTVLSKPDDPLLPAKSIDAVLLLKTYHEVAEPVSLLQNLRQALRSKARVGIIDRNGNGENHGVDRDTVVREAGQAGYTLIGEYDFVKSDGQDYFLVFKSD